MFRELDQRQSQQISVTLEWDPATGVVRVRCENDRSPEQGFTYSVDPRDARLAFLHPLALRPSGEAREPSVSRADQRQSTGRTRWRRWFRGRADSEPAERSSDYSWIWWLPYGTSDPPAWL
jgi:hypothetical protein